MTRFEKLLLWWSTAAVTVTGLVYAWMKYLVQPADEWAVVNHPLQPLVLKLHILVAPVLVFAVGMIATRHVVAHLRARTAQGRRSGTAAALVIVPMILSGYLIQTVTDSGWLTALGWVHLGTGVVFAAASAVHGVTARRRRTRVQAPRSRDGMNTSRSTRRPAMSLTTKRPPSTVTSSPSSGMRPSRPRT
jgi:hypothetical protein